MLVARTDARPETIVSSYQAAIGLGAGVIVGPLTRSGVAALAKSDSTGITTLALNTPEGDPPSPSWLHTFGLSVESEARHVARVARQSRLGDAVVVKAATPLAERASQAFVAEWLALGGKVEFIQAFGPGADLNRMRRRLARSEAEMLFLAADAEQARLVRPYLNNQIPVYATSQVYDGPSDSLASLELNGILFVDMPWLIQPDLASVGAYPRPESLGVELQRFYALGIDACRLAVRLMDRARAIELDGVTGRISLNGQDTFRREPVLATIRGGTAVPVGAPR